MIRFDSVSKIYSGTSKPALNDVTLEILRGEFVFLVGASGSGKSTFLRLVLKEDKPTKGTIHVLGQQLSQLSGRKVPYYRRNLGVVFQDFRLLPNKTVFDNVAFTLQVIGKSRGFIQEAVPDVLKMVGLAGKAQRLPHELSGGEQQRVAIARAVVNKPAVLLADEPTGNLDPATSAGIMQVLDRINLSGTTVVMATHDSTIVDEMQRRVIELIGGEIVRDERRGGYQTTTIPIQREGADARTPQAEEFVGVPGSAAMSGGPRTGSIVRPLREDELQTVARAQAVAAEPTVAGTPAASSQPEPQPSTPASGSTVGTAPFAGDAAVPAPSTESRPAAAETSPATGTIRRLPEGTGVIDLSALASGGDAGRSAVPVTAGVDLKELGLAEKLGLRKADDDLNDARSQEVGPTS
ncbi:cell division ATP-binding protein FtsE [Planctomonas deserti]|uniref:cell division ATP-binding protein FtsE n=1 Tax=Planctomonas deserti TaxID=2144185 RepID=UPI000D3AC5EC|nr:cell division ATP-binding protein FtsE [Planctomonas deserti]